MPPERKAENQPAQPLHKEQSRKRGPGLSLMTRVHWVKRGGRALRAHGWHEQGPESVSKQGDLGICRARIQLESRNMGRDKRAGQEGPRGSLEGILCKGTIWSDLGFGRNALVSEMKVDRKRVRLEESWHRVQLLGGQRGQHMRGGRGCSWEPGSFHPKSPEDLYLGDMDP